MQFEDLVEGYEDRPITGTLVAMWRQVAMSGLTRGELLRVVGIALLAYGALWVALFWAAL